MSDYYGFSTKTISSPFLKIDILTTAGPRLVRLTPAGADLNLFAEVPELHWFSPAGEFYPLGGHRLWAAPELPEITYLPDGEGVKIEEIPGGLRMSREDHCGVNYQRVIELTLDQALPRVILKHSLKNLAVTPLAPLVVAPWAVTQFRMGGKVFIPLADSPADANNLMPNRSLALWPYTKLSDPRLTLTDTAVEIKAKPMPEALKVGVYSPRGWAAIEFAEGWVLIKHFKVLKPEVHTDFNTNVQCSVRDVFIELETLGKLSLLQSGEVVTHIEEWEIRQGTLRSLGLV